MTIHSDTSTASLPAYRVAWVMNNMSVSMLKRGHGVEAAKSLHDALIVIQAVFSSASNNENNSEDRDEQDCPSSISNRLDYVNKVAVAMFERVRSRASNKGDDKPSSSPIMAVDIEDVEEDEYASVRAAARYGPSLSLLFPIRIQQSIEMDGLPSQVSRHLGIILYNFGLAQLVCALLEHQRHRNEGNLQYQDSSFGYNQKTLAKACKALQMAHVTFLRLFRQQEKETEDNMPCILLDAMVLHSLALVFRLQQQDDKAEEVQRGVTEFLSSKSFDEPNYCFLYERRQMAPAA